METIISDDKIIKVMKLIRKIYVKMKSEGTNNEYEKILISRYEKLRYILEKYLIQKNIPIDLILFRYVNF